VSVSAPRIVFGFIFQLYYKVAGKYSARDITTLLRPMNRRTLHAISREVA